MISFGTKRRRSITKLREWGKKKLMRAEQPSPIADKDNIDTTNDKEEEEVNEDIENEIQTKNNDDIGPPTWVPDSPIYVPPATFSSPEISDDDQMKVTTHTTMEVKTIDTLNANNVMMISSERDKMKLGGILRNHPLLFHFNRTLWPVLFVTCQLKGLMPLQYDFDNPRHMKTFKLLLIRQEDQVMEALKKTYPSTKSSNAVDLCSKIVFNIDPRYPTFLQQYGKVKNILDIYSPTEEEQRLIMEYWKTTWNEKVLGPTQVKAQLKSTLFSATKTTSLDTFMKNLLCVLHERMIEHEKIVHLGENYDYRAYSNSHSDKGKNSKTATTQESKPLPSNAGKTLSKGSNAPRCKGCGNDPTYQAKNNKNGLACDISKSSCLFKRHEDFNNTEKPFIKSDVGLHYKNTGNHWLRIDKKLSDDKTSLIARAIPKRRDTDKKVNTDSCLYNQVSNLDNYLDNIPGDLNKPVVSLVITDKNGNSSEFDALIDPGSYSLTSTSSNVEIVSYISDNLYKMITGILPSHEPCTCKPTKTCTATGCFTSTTCLNVTGKLKDEYSSTGEIQIAFRVVKALNDNQIIIGLNDVKKYDLTRVFRHLFSNDITNLNHGLNIETQPDILDKQPDTTQSTPVSPKQDNSTSIEEGEDVDNHFQSKTSRREVILQSIRRSKRLNPTGIHSQSWSGSQPNHDKSHATLMSLQLNNLIEGKLISKDELLTKEDDTDYIEDFIDDNLLDDLYNMNDIQNDLQTTVEEHIESMLSNVQDKDMRSRLQNIVYKYTNVFSTELSNKAALVTPYSIPLKPDNDWITDKNRHPPRWQTIAKSYEVEKFIKKAIACNMIKPSDAPAWSQILLTPKKNGSYRFCVDFRALNNATHSSGWPLPNIKHVLDRLSKKKPKYFTILDLTSGYFQIPIDEQSQFLTAFRTAIGLFEWTRLPMGLKGAGSYFQMQMHKIFEDLLYNIIEIYLDDILIFAQTKEELITNTEIVLERLRKHNITVNPEKVKMGLTEVEYVGHLIDKHGISFSQEKKQKVFDFRLPEKAHELKSFLGLCSQYRDHIQGYAQLSAPLHDMLKGYTKKSRHKLPWTENLKQTYYTFKDAVANCGKLFFVDEDKPIFLNTDASYHGIGAALYQMDEEGMKIPIQFISKKLNVTELGWNIVEKEAYSIFYAIMKLDHLLRDQYFILQTDSKILSHMNTDHKDKVKRWKIAIQHFNFDVLHIEGKQNIEADALSRLVPFPTKQDTQPTMNNLEQINMIERREYLPKKIFKKIQQAHNAITGHSGVQKTIDRLQKLNLKWSGMRKDVSTFVNNCPCCQKMNTIKPLIHTIPFTLSHYRPMNRICVDAIGPIDIDNQNIKHIFVIIDAFSRYTRLYPLESINSSEVLKAFYSWIADFGCPSEIVSDNASYFISELVKSFIDFSKIKHATIHPYSHEENGLVERANKEVIRHLTAIIADQDVRRNFPDYLPFIQRIMNTQINSRTKISPTQMIFGNAVNHDSHFLSEPIDNNVNESAIQYMDNLLKIQQTIITIAQDNQQQNDTHHIATQENLGNYKQTHFPINSYVLAEYETRKESKLHTKKHGPYRVINRIGTIYTLENLATNKLVDFHVKLLSPYNHDSDNSDITKVAKIDEELADIVKVINHRFKGQKKNLSNLELLLVWEDNPNPDWFPWNSTYRSNELIHKYFNENQMRKFIPSEFTWGKDHPDYEPPTKKRKT